jgi:putative transposase
MVGTMNEDGYEGLVPHFAGGRPSKLTDKEKTQLKRF